MPQCPCGRKARETGYCDACLERMAKDSGGQFEIKFHVSNCETIVEPA